MSNKMQALCEQVEEKLSSLQLPYLQVSTSDNLCSSVVIRGSFWERNVWPNGIFHNAPYFLLFIRPEKDRYYEPASNSRVTLELVSKGRGVDKLRKYTSTPDKVVDKLYDWLKNHAFGGE